MSKVTITLYRHGKTVNNGKGLIQGYTADSKLSPEGENQALMLAEKVNFADFDIILSSDSGRSMQTAILATGLIEKDMLINEAFREMHFGIFEGDTYQALEIQAKEKQAIMLDVNHPETFSAKFEGGESHQEVVERVQNKLQEIIQENPDTKNICLFIHGAVMTNLVKKHKNIWVSGMANTASIELNYDKDSNKFYMN